MEQKKQTNRMKIVIPIVIVVAVIVAFFYMKTNDSPSKSQVDGISDEVYEELVQWYFYTVTFMERLENSNEDDTEFDGLWFEDHELFEDAEVYAETNDELRPFDVFPNPLIYEYMTQPGEYTDTEQPYIERMYEFHVTFQRLDDEEYEALKEELKEDLHIKKSYNPFD